MNWIKELFERYHKRGMTELGRELYEIFNSPDEYWELCEPLLRHKGSGLELWVGNGCSFLHIHKLPNTSCFEPALRHLLNTCDKRVLWREVQILKAYARNNLPAQEALNALRLARYRSSKE